MYYTGITLTPPHLATSQTHSPLPHSMWAGEVQLQSISPGPLGQLAQLSPVILGVATHQTSDDNLTGGGQTFIHIRV